MQPILARDRSLVCAIAVIAKAPRPGHVKTRLQGLLEPDEAAALGRTFLRDTLENLGEAGRHAAIDSTVAYAPQGEEARFAGLLPPGTTLLLADGRNGCAPGVEGFGCVLLDTTRALLSAGYGAACVLGADSPTVPTGELVRAALLLLGGACDAVLGPSEDGGYWLLGLRAPRHEPFAGIAWSTASAAADTRARLSEAGLRTVELRRWYDVDDASGLARLLEDGGGYAAPHTTALLQCLGIRARLQAAS